MSQIEIDVLAGREAELFNTVVFQFLEWKSSVVAADSTIKIRSDPRQGFERKTLQLWDEHAVEEFRSYWLAVKARAGRNRAI